MHKGRTVTIVRYALILLATLPAAAQAQEPGRVVGRVVDQDTGTPIVGATVRVTDGAAVLTNLDGRYILRDVVPGTHQLMVEMIGYATKTVTGVEVAAGGVASLDVTMAARAVELDAITVSAARERGSTAALLDERRTAAGVTDAVGAQEISRGPDGDAAAVLARAPGVSVVDSRYVLVRGLGDRYGAATLNGAPLPSPEADRKVVPLDIVPSGFLQSVVTAKTYSASQPGDYAGGLVQIRTGNFPTRPTVKVGLGTSYNSAATFGTGLAYEGGTWDFLGFDDGTRSLPALPAQRITPGTHDAASLERFGEGFVGSWGPVATSLPLAQS
ncbi:MAG TPA: carboxypeptidase regulatory-like domain-containing protein, partial [Longimicrobiales bacterium]|nr:carboxypeptidase regulatory-like domain-containing protein [Longimicrobiales bacterium]